MAQRAHEALLRKHESDRLVGHISRDSTDIEAHERPVYKPKEETEFKPERKRGRLSRGEEPPTREPSRLDKQMKMTLEEMLADLPMVFWGHHRMALT